jgi:hypothetical protein
MENYVMTVHELIRKLTEAPGGDLYVEILQTDSRSLLLLVEENGLSTTVIAIIDMDGEASNV